MARYTPIEAVLNFVDRTTGRGVPLRVALTRAERRFGLSRDIVRAFWRSERSSRAEVASSRRLNRSATRTGR